MASLLEHGQDPGALLAHGERPGVIARVRALLGLDDPAPVDPLAAELDGMSAAERLSRIQALALDDDPRVTADLLARARADAELEALRGRKVARERAARQDDQARRASAERIAREALDALDQADPDLAAAALAWADLLEAAGRALHHGTAWRDRAAGPLSRLNSLPKDTPAMPVLDEARARALALRVTGAGDARSLMATLDAALRPGGRLPASMWAALHARTTD